MNMNKKTVTITVTYGHPNQAIILNAVMVAVSELTKKGIDARVLQVYMPGTKPSISVNGKYVVIDEFLHKRIEEEVYETLTDEAAEDIIDYLVLGIAAAVLENSTE
ncbi:MAG: hypothetical protein J7L82_00745 [Staphylothermus sp.]|nr:hypothetical protein [Staphylothermus sp.]